MMPNLAKPVQIAPAARKRGDKQTLYPVLTLLKLSFARV
jgi:hypothetical protein